jgi:hypothetical protein
MDEPTVQALIQMGQQAAQLLQNQTYLLAHQGSINDLINELVSSEPHEAKKRESLYLQIRAHGLAANQLAMMVGRAQDLLERQRAAQSPSDGLDRQGFGLNDDWQPENPAPDGFM